MLPLYQKWGWVKPRYFTVLIFCNDSERELEFGETVLSYGSLGETITIFVAQRNRSHHPISLLGKFDDRLFVAHQIPD